MKPLVNLVLVLLLGFSIFVLIFKPILFKKQVLVHSVDSGVRRTEFILPSYIRPDGATYIMFYGGEIVLIDGMFYLPDLCEGGVIDIYRDSSTHANFIKCVRVKNTWVVYGK